MSLRAVVFAYQDVGYVGLEALLEMGAEIPAVITHEDSPGEEIWFRSVRELAEKHDLPVFTPAKLDAEWVERLRRWQPEFLFSFYYRNLLPTAVLETASRAALNLHGSLLPRYRGRCPVNWVLIHGEGETGVTLHHMVEKPDRGDIVAQERVEITDEDTARSLYGKMTTAAARLMRDIYPRLVDGTAPRIPQDQAKASYFGGRKPEDGRIHWEQDARAVYNLVRAVTHPYPGAFTTVGGKKLFVWQAKPGPGAGGRGPVGEVLEIGPRLLVRAGGDSLLELVSIQSEGEEEMSAGRWAGREKLAVGTILGG